MTEPLLCGAKVSNYFHVLQILSQKNACLGVFLALAAKMLQFNSYQHRYQCIETGESSPKTLLAAA
jgi:hypothetical protein